MEQSADAAGEHWWPAGADILAGFATRDFFDALGVRIPLGRSFGASDDRRGASPVAILTDRYWRRTFDADRGVIGRTITIAGKPVTIVGVAARGFRGLNLAIATDLYLPLHVIGDLGSPYTNYFADANHVSSPSSGLRIIGLLPPDLPPFTGGRQALEPGPAAGNPESAAGRHDRD